MTAANDSSNSWLEREKALLYLVGARLTSVQFVLEYLILGFDEKGALTTLVWPENFQGTNVTRFGLPQTTQTKPNPPPPCPSGPNYLNRYTNFVSNYAIDIGPYAVGLLGGVWPKSLVPWTGGAGLALGSTNPLTSVPRALNIPGTGSSIVRTGAAGIGLATVGIGMYDATIELEGFIYAIPTSCSQSQSSSQSQGN